MRALVYKAPNEMVLEDIENPPIKDKDVCIRVRYCGICGSDVHGYMGLSGRRNPGVVMGHEFSGYVESVGAQVRSVRPGDRVTAFPLLFCGQCEMCSKGLQNQCENQSFLGVFSTNGAFADRVTVPEKCIVRLPDDMSDELGAMIEPFAVGYRAAHRASILPGQSLLIVGAGTIGIMTLINALSYHPRGVLVSDLSDRRLELAHALGAYTVNPGKEDLGSVIQKCFGTKEVDAAIEAVGVSATIGQAVNALKDEGVCVCIGNTQIGPSIPMQRIVTHELQVVGTHIYTLEEFRSVPDVMLTQRKHIERMISCVCTPEEGIIRMRQLAEGDDRLLKVLICFD